ncbi:MAG: hypothetical protein MI745_16640 [Pseudomonadales bacterium]|nr:hypothetical protein [Pseudomonadales bacterium]
MSDSNNNQHDDRETRSEGKVLEKEKLLLLGLVILVAGALILGFFAHSEGIEARDALKGIKASLSEAVDELG